jgi:hypothetical protein
MREEHNLGPCPPLQLTKDEAFNFNLWGPCRSNYHQKPSVSISQIRATCRAGHLMSRLEIWPALYLFPV